MSGRILGWVAAELLLPLWAVSAAASSAVPGIIPLPQKMERHPGEFTLQPATRILADASSRDTGEYLAERLRKSTGFPLKLDVSRHFFTKDEVKRLLDLMAGAFEVQTPRPTSHGA